MSNEARILARLEHPGIVPVHDFGELPDGRLFYAMKRVRGDRLDRWMASGRDLAERLGVFLRVCETVAFAHAHGVIHRDLKPENVMVGEFGEVLVLDWGVAQLRNADCGLRIEGAIVGTPDYMAPEQARGDAASITAPTSSRWARCSSRLRDTAPVLAIARKARSADPGVTLSGRARRSPPTSAASSPAARSKRIASVWSIVSHAFGRRYRLPILLVLTYLVVAGPAAVAGSRLRGAAICWADTWVRPTTSDRMPAHSARRRQILAV